MTPNDLHVFELIEAGLVSKRRAPLYEPALSRLIEAGIVHLPPGADVYEPTDLDVVGRRQSDGSSTLAPPEPPRAPPMGQMMVRMPQWWIDFVVATAVDQKTDKSKVFRDLIRPIFEKDDGTPLHVAAPAVAPLAHPKAAKASRAKHAPKATAAKAARRVRPSARRRAG